MNWSALKSLTAERLALGLTMLVIIWLPLPGGARPPALLAALVGAWLIWRHGRALFAREAVRRWTVVFLLLWVPSLLSVPAAFNVKTAAGIVAVMPLFYLTGIAMLLALEGERERLLLARVIGVVLVFWVVDALIQWVFGVDLLGVSLGGDGRVLGPFFDTTRMGTFIGVLLPVLLWLMAGLRPWWALLAYVGAFAITVLNGTRTGQVLVLLVGMAWALRLPRRYLAPLILIPLILAVAMAGLVPAAKERMERTLAVRTLDFKTVDSVLSGRLTIWETAGHMVADRPLTGIGVGNFKYAYDRYATRPDDLFRSGGAMGFVSHAHNMYIAVAADAGLIGLAGLLMIAILALRWYFIAPKEHREQAWPWALGLAVIGFPVNSQPVLIYAGWFPIPALLMCAMLMAVSPGRVKPSQA